MGGKEKCVRRRDLEPKREGAKCLHGGRKVRDGIWVGLREGAWRGGVWGPSAKFWEKHTARQLQRSTAAQVTHPLSSMAASVTDGVTG